MLWITSSWWRLKSRRISMKPSAVFSRVEKLLLNTALLLSLRCSSSCATRLFCRDVAAPASVLFRFSRFFLREIWPFECVREDCALMSFSERFCGAMPALRN